jgi:RES domain-containing protein
VLRDPALLDRLSEFPTGTFDGDVYRVTRRSLDPLAPSTAGGRWAPRGGVAVLYTSLERDGALAEISFHWGQLTPLPSKPAVLNRLGIVTQKTLRLILASLEALGVTGDEYATVNYARTQEIGDAIAFLECDGVLVPSARWRCDNLVLFPDNHALNPPNRLEVLDSEECDWLAWARQNNLIDPPNP